MIIVKDMNMPKNCRECPMRCIMSTSPTAMSAEDKSEYCPLVEVKDGIKLSTWDLPNGKEAEAWLIKGKLQVRALGNIHNIDILDIKNEKTKTIKSIDEIQNEMEYGDVFSSEEFKTEVENGGINEYDGIGYYHDGQKETDVSVWSKDEIDTSYPYVCWYNK